MASDSPHRAMSNMNKTAPDVWRDDDDDDDGGGGSGDELDEAVAPAPVRKVVSKGALHRDPSRKAAGVASEARQHSRSLL